MPKGLYNFEKYAIIYKLSVTGGGIFGPVAQLGERTVRIREVRGFDPLRVHQIGNHRSENCGDFSLSKKSALRADFFE